MRDTAQKELNDLHKDVIRLAQRVVGAQGDDAQQIAAADFNTLAGALVTKLDEIAAADRKLI